MDMKREKPIVSTSNDLEANWRDVEVLGTVQKNLHSIDDRLYISHMRRLGALHGIMAGIVVGLLILGAKALWM